MLDHKIPSNRARSVDLRPRLAATGVALALILGAGAAQAQNTGLAEELFARGQKLMEEGKIREACVQFAESQSAEPSTGTLLNLAVCHEKEKKTATAWAEFLKAAGSARVDRRPDRETFANERAAALATQLRKVRLDMKEVPPGTQVRIDAQTFNAAAVIGHELPVDPGEHTIAVSAPKKTAWEQKMTFEVGPGVTPIEVPALEDAPDDVAPAAPIAQTAPAPAPLDPVYEQQVASARSRRTLGFILGGVGVVGIGTSIVFFARTAAQNSDAQSASRRGDAFEAASRDPNASSAERETAAQNATNFRAFSVSERDAAVTSQTVAFIAGGVGLVGLGVGAYFILTSKTPPPPASSSGIRDFRVTPLLGATQGMAASFSF